MKKTFSLEELKNKLEHYRVQLRSANRDGVSMLRRQIRRLERQIKTIERKTN